MKLTAFAILAVLVAGCTDPGDPPTTTTTAETTTSSSSTSTTASTTTTTTPSNSSCGRPVGTPLTDSNGEWYDQPNAVIENMHFHGTVSIDAPNVTIRNSEFSGTGGTFGVRVFSGSVTIEDSTFNGNWSKAAIVFDNWTVRRTEFTGLPDDGVVLGSNTLLEDSCFHDWATVPGNHSDAAQMQNGSTNVVVNNNKMLMPLQSNSAMFIAPDLGPSSNGPVTITNNLVSGGNYTVYIVDGNNGQYFVNNITFTGNRFIRDTARYGPLSVNVPVTMANNVWDDDNSPVN